jgi:myosin-7
MMADCDFFCGSGESGAGKTESTKLILQYLALLSGKHSQVEQNILDSSSILESFGNACTVRNNNSSRFGKFIEIQFNDEGKIEGARIHEYLLEKSRIVHQAAGERNYHCFYTLLAGMPQVEKNGLFLTKAADYHYLNQSGHLVVETWNDADEFEKLKVAQNTKKRLICLTLNQLDLLGCNG